MVTFEQAHVRHNRVDLSSQYWRHKKVDATSIGLNVMVDWYRIGILYTYLLVYTV